MKNTKENFATCEYCGQEYPSTEETCPKCKKQNEYKQTPKREVIYTSCGEFEPIPDPDPSIH